MHQKLSDSSSFLWRSELAGHPRDPARWAKLLDYAREKIPRPGFSLAATIDLIVPMLPERERMGGSRAQVDLVEAML